jgi:hypothetical protein
MPTPIRARLGRNCILKYGAAGATATNDLLEVDSVDLTLDSDSVDTTVRGRKFGTKTKALMNAKLEIVLVRRDAANAGYEALMTSYWNSAPMSILCKDGIDANADGIDGDFEVMSVSRPEKINDGIRITFSLEPTDSPRDVVRATGAGVGTGEE